jgi:hypothetical protein
MTKFVDVLSRWEAGELSMMAGGELLGMSERQFRLGVGAREEYWTKDLSALQAPPQCSATSAFEGSRAIAASKSVFAASERPKIAAASRSYSGDELVAAVVLRDSGIFRTRRNDAATIERVIAGVPGKPRYYVLDGGKLERLLRKKPSRT